METTQIAAIIVAAAAFMASTLTGVAAVIVAWNGRTRQAVIVSKVDKANATLVDVHQSTNSNFTRLRNELYASLGVIVLGTVIGVGILSRALTAAAARSPTAGIR